MTSNTANGQVCAITSTPAATLTVNDAGLNYSFGGNLTGAGLALTKMGTGTLTLTSSVNSFAGGVTVNAGTLIGSASNAFGASSGTLTETSGGTLSFGIGNMFAGGTSTAVATLSIQGGVVTNTGGGINNALNNVTLNSGTLTSAGGNSAWGAWDINGAVTSAGTSAITGAALINLNGSGGTTTFNVSGGTLTVPVAISNGNGGATAAGLNKSGTGVMLLSGSAGYTGNTLISAGTLAIGGAGSLGTTGSYSGTISNSGALSVNISGNETFAGAISGSGILYQLGTGYTTISGANTSYTGTSTLTQGALIFGQSTSWGTGTRPINVAAGTILGAGYPINQNLLGAVATASTGNAFTVALASSSSNNLNFSTAPLSLAVLGAIGAQTYSGVLTPYGTTYRLGGISGGTLTLAESAVPTTTDNLVITGPSTVNFSTTSSFAGLSLLGGLLTSTSGALIVNNPAIYDMESGTASLILAGTAPLQKTTAGNVFLTANNSTYTGGTTVSGGTLTLSGGTSVLGTGSSIAVSNGAMLSVATGGDLALGATNSAQTINLTSGGIFDQPATATLSLAATRNINIGTGGGTIQTDIANSAGKVFLGFTNQLTGAGTLTKTGSGDLQISGSNSFTGNVNVGVNGGFLELQNPNALGGSSGGTITVNNGAEVAAGLTVPNALTLNTGATLSGESTGAGNFGGAINAAGNFNVGLRNFFSATTPSGLTISGPLSGAGNMTLAGTGALTLTGNNTGYSGAITVGANTMLRAPSSGSINPLGSAAIVLGGSNGTYTFAPALSSSGSSPGFFASYYQLGAAPAAVGGYDFGYYTATGNRIEPTLNQSNANPPVYMPPNVNNTNYIDEDTGILNISGTGAGTYTFTTYSDDGSMLYVDGQMVVTNDPYTNFNAHTGTISLTPGLHTISVRHSQGGGGGGMNVQYSGPDTNSVTVLVGSVANTLTNIGANLFSTTLLTNTNALSISSGSTGVLELEGVNVNYTGTLTFGASSNLTVQGITGYENLNLAGSVVLSGSNKFLSGSAQGTATALPGLDVTLSGAVSGTGATLIKAGPQRVLTLTGNNAATLTTSILDIQGGYLAATSSASLGDATNIVKLDSNSATQGFRAAGTFALPQTVVLNQAANDIDVLGGNTLTLNSALSVPTATNVLTKTGLGTLVLTASNPSTWTGGISVAAGILQISNSNQLGASSGTLTISQYVGAAVQISGGITIPNPVNLNSTGNNYGGASGINNGGALENTSGTNTLSGQLTTFSQDTNIGADAGSQLNLTGGIAPTGHILYFDGSGNFLITGGSVGALYGITKQSAGTLTVQVPVGGITNSNLMIEGGTMVLSGSAGSLSTGGAADAVNVYAGATLTVDDSQSTTTVANRLGTHAVTLSGAALNYVGNGLSVSSESSTATLTIGAGQDTVSIGDSSSGTATLNFLSLTVNGNAQVNFTAPTGGTLGSISNRITFNTIPTLTPTGTGIITRATVNGLDFATYNATGSTPGVVPFSAYNTSNNIDTALATDTMKLGSSYQLLYNPTKTINALALTGGGVTVDSAFAGAPLSLTAGNLLVNTGSNTITSNVVLAFNGTETALQVNSGTLNIQGPISTTANLSKSLGGTLILSGPVYNTSANWNYFNGGTTVLSASNSPFNSTLLPNMNVVVAAGASLDLNGSTQVINNLAVPNGVAYQGSGGTVTSSTAVGTLVDLGAASYSFPGLISGNLFLGKAGSNTLTLNNPNTYNQATLVSGGILSLKDYGTLAATSSINVNYATLTWDNTGLADVSNRVNASAPVTLNGGIVNYVGRAVYNSSGTLGQVNVSQGFSSVNVTVSNVGVASAALSIAGLTHSPDATVNFTGTNGVLGGVSTYAINNPQLLVNSGGSTPALVNGIWPWAVVNGDNFATYSSTYGIGGMDTASFVTSDGVALPTSSQPTQNIHLTTVATATPTLPAGGLTINSLNMYTYAAAGTLTFTNSTDTLYLTSGGLLVAGNQADKIGATVDSGRLTAGTAGANGPQDLYVYNNQNTLTINSRIVDNSVSAPVRLVLTTNGSTISLTDSNTYTGGTVVNGTTVTLSNTTAGLVVIPNGTGGVTLNNAALTAGTAGQIATGNTVTLNGGSTLTLVGNNSLNGIVFNNNGGTGAPTVTTGGTLTLPAAGITASSGNAATTAVINGTLNFSSATHDHGQSHPDQRHEPAALGPHAQHRRLDPQRPRTDHRHGRRHLAAWRPEHVHRRRECHLRRHRSHRQQHAQHHQCRGHQRPLGYRNIDLGIQFDGDQQQPDHCQPGDRRRRHRVRRQRRHHEPDPQRSSHLAGCRECQPQRVRPFDHRDHQRRDYHHRRHDDQGGIRDPGHRRRHQYRGQHHQCLYRRDQP